MVQRLRAFDARHPVVADLLVTAVIALVGVVGSLDGTLDATVAPQVSDPPAALPVALHVAFTVPVLWRRTHPLAVLWALTAAAGVMVWCGLDHPGVLGLVLVAGSAALRLPLPRLAGPGAVLVAAVGASALRWPPGDVALRYVPLLLVLVGAALVGVTVRTRRAYLDSRVELAIAAERARIAREMHDVVAHNLAVMVALADGAAYSLAEAPQRATDLIGKVSASGREALDDMRRLVGVLRKDDDGVPGGEAPTHPQPGLDDLDGLVDQVRAAGLQVRLRRSGTPGPWGPGAGAGLAAYRIVQEALTNAMKHAGPGARVDVHLDCSPTAVHIEVVDDGGGRPHHRDGTGHGLAGMVERAAAYDGHVEAGPDPSGGWRVVARLEPGGAAPVGR